VRRFFYRGNAKRCYFCIQADKRAEGKTDKELKISRGEKKIISKEATVRLLNSNNGNQRTMNCLLSAKRKPLVQNSTSS